MIESGAEDLTGAIDDARDKREGAMRRCIATGQTLPAERLVRFVLDPDDNLVPDVAHRLPGRGVWVVSDRSAVLIAVKKNLFSKAFKQKLCVSETLDQLIERLLAHRCGQYLSFARRAGLVVQGYAQVEERLARAARRIAALVEASDSGAADRGKLISMARRTGSIPIVGCLSRSEIGLALGREDVVHAALAPGALSSKFVLEAGRLGGFRALCPEDWITEHHSETEAAKD